MNQNQDRFATEGAVEFAALAFFQAGVAVERQAIEHHSPATSAPAEVATSEGNVEKLQPIDLTEPTLASADAAERAQAGSRFKFVQTSVASNQANARFSVSAAQSVAPPSSVSGDPRLQLPPCAHVGEAIEVQTAESTRRQPLLRWGPPTPVAVGLGEVEGHVTVFARVAGLSAEEECEFELRVRDELTANRRGLNQLTINGRLRPGVGGK